MNIKQAKEELLSTIQAYLVKDETGEYAIPTERQRPILLMGPPGIGKTAIMEQVAEEAHINLVPTRSRITRGRAPSDFPSSGSASTAEKRIRSRNTR